MFFSLPLPKDQQKYFLKNKRINEIIYVVAFCPSSAFRLYAYRQSNTMWRSVDSKNVSGVIVAVLPHRRKSQVHRHQFSPAVNTNWSEQGRKSSLAPNLSGWVTPEGKGSLCRPQWRECDESPAAFFHFHDYSPDLAERGDHFTGNRTWRRFSPETPFPAPALWATQWRGTTKPFCEGRRLLSPLDKQSPRAASCV